jgi:hypothetical protein
MPLLRPGGLHAYNWWRRQSLPHSTQMIREKLSDKDFNHGILTRGRSAAYSTFKFLRRFSSSETSCTSGAGVRKLLNPQTLQRRGRFISLDRSITTSSDSYPNESKPHGVSMQNILTVCSTLIFMPWLGYVSLQEPQPALNDRLH